MNVNPRKKFSTASRFDKIKRSALYRAGQHRLWVDRRRVKGPVRLLHIHKRMNVHEVPLSEQLWVCELMWRDENRIIGEYDLGTEVNEMEAIAWATI